MRQTRPHRVLTALIALFGMLFMQLAVAAYSCPGLQGGGMDASAMLADDAPSMPDCEPSGASQPALCHAHCQGDTPSLDKPQVQTFTPAVVLFWPVPAAIEPVLARPQVHPEASSLLQRTTAPPIAIRHCCFRI
jgi:hypothetical protein